MKYFFILLILFFEITDSYATTYYLSNSGNDFNDGLSESWPWETIARLNSQMEKIVPGDIILFERGSIFAGEINLYASGNETSPIIFSAYGNGKDPVITGSIPITKWSVYKDKIFKASTDTIVNNLFTNGQQMILARYPNSNFLTIKEPLTNSKEGFIDSELKQPPGYWNGSIVRMRTTHWSYEYTPIKNFNEGRIIFSNETYYPTVSGWGYYLDNNFNELDTPKEWYFERGNNSNGVIYHFFPEDIKPNELNVEGSIFSYGFYTQNNITNIIIRNLQFHNQSISGLYFTGDISGINIENCTFNGQIQSAISFLGKSVGCEVNNCRFGNINGEAIYWLTCKNTILSNSIFKNIGMIPGYGKTMDAFNMSAVVILSSDSNHIFKNYIDSVGHDGINCLGSGNVIEKNIISNTLLLLNDGAAIKCYGLNSNFSTWNNNFISNVIGNLVGVPKSSHQMGASGIYLDAYCNEMKILNNTIVNCGHAGIFLYEGNEKNFINGNVCYDNPIGIEFYQNQQAMIGNIVTNNIFFGLNPKQISVKLRARSWDFFPGQFDSNYYYNNFNNSLFQQQAGIDIRNNDFNNWKILNGSISDNNSKILDVTQSLFSKIFVNMSDDSLLIPLNANYSYKDLNLNNITESIVIQPWFSKILLINSDLRESPEINISGGPLYFEEILKGDYSATQWYSLIGNNLSEPVIIKAPEGFSISLYNDMNFTNTLTIYPESGKLNEIIFVKFTPNTEKDYYDFITNTCGELNALVKVTGNLR